LAPTRDRLYSLALGRAASAAAAESLLQRTARQLFHKLTADPFLNVACAMENALLAKPAGASAQEETAMPADVWARLAAAIQLEAASSAHTGALHPDSVLLQPDPLLAPKKTRPHADDAPFDVASPARL